MNEDTARLQSFVRTRTIHCFCHHLACLCTLPGVTPDPPADFPMSSVGKRLWLAF